MNSFLCGGAIESLGSRILCVAAACSIHRHIPTFSAGRSRPRAPPPSDLFPRLYRAGVGAALLVCRQTDCSGKRYAAAVPHIFLFEPRDNQKTRVYKTKNVGPVAHSV